MDKWELCRGLIVFLVPLLFTSLIYIWYDHPPLVSKIVANNTLTSISTGNILEGTSPSSIASIDFYGLKIPVTAYACFDNIGIKAVLSNGEENRNFTAYVNFTDNTKLIIPFNQTKCHREYVNSDFGYQWSFEGHITINNSQTESPAVGIVKINGSYYILHKIQEARIDMPVTSYSELTEETTLLIYLVFFIAVGTFLLFLGKVFRFIVFGFEVYRKGERK